VSDLVASVARRQGRLDWRLAAAGVRATPTHRLAADVAFKTMAPYLAAYLPPSATTPLDARSNGAVSEKRRRPGSEEGGKSRLTGAVKGADEVLDAALLWEHAWLLKLGGCGGWRLECAAMPPQARLECPAWAWAGLQDAFGAWGTPGSTLEAELLALQLPAPLDLRVNTLKAPPATAATLAAIQAAGFFGAAAAPWAPHGIRMPSRVPLGSIPGLLEGLVEPMDAG
jgi:hypothetical protein